MSVQTDKSQHYFYLDRWTFSSLTDSRIAKSFPLGGLVDKEDDRALKLQSC